MIKLNLEKVNSRKQLEAQGYFEIRLNKEDCFQYFKDELDEPKYVLTNNKNLFFNYGGDVLIETPVWSVKEALNIYNSGIYTTKN